MIYLVYGDGGDHFFGDKYTRKEAVAQMKLDRKTKFYAIGYRWHNWERQGVVVGFAERPSQGEIAHRRRNGFLGVKVYSATQVEQKLFKTT